MSSLLCTTSCVGLPLPNPLNECDLAPQVTTGEFFIFLSCDYQFTDIANPVEWAAAIASGDVTVTPDGFFGKPLPAQTNFDISCARKHQVQEGQQFVFESSLTVQATQEDQIFYKDLRAGASNFKVIPVICNSDGTHEFLIQDEYLEDTSVPGESPGFDFSWIVPPDYIITSGLNNLFSWNFTLQIPVPGIVCRRDLPGVYAALKA